MSENIIEEYQDHIKAKKVVKELDLTTLANRATLILGAQGSGKTATTVNQAIATFNNDQSVFLYDVSDGGMLRQFLESIPPNKRHRVVILNFANTHYPIPCTFDEVLKYEEKNEDIVFQLAMKVVETIQSFIPVQFGEVTFKYLLAICIGVFSKPEATIAQVFAAVQDVDYLRDKVLPNISIPATRRHILEFLDMNKNQRLTILDPIIDQVYRLEYNCTLWNCIAQPPLANMDYRKWMDGDEDGAYAVLVWIPNSLPSDTQRFLMVQQIRKLWFAVQTRRNTLPLESRNNFLVVLDEVYQFTKGITFFNSLLRESRSLRMQLTLLCNEIPAMHDRSLLEDMYASSNTLLLKGSCSNYDKLWNIFQPFTKKEYIELPRYHAIVATIIGKDNASIIKLPTPYTTTHRTYDNSDLWDICAPKYGRPREEVKRLLERVIADESII